MKNMIEKIMGVLNTPVVEYWNWLDAKLDLIPIPQWWIDFVNYFIKPVDGDAFYRSAFTIQTDTLGGVDFKQLVTRYHYTKHAVVKNEVQPDWVDEFEMWLDEKLAFVIHKP